MPTFEVVAKVFSTPSIEVVAKSSTDWAVLAFNGGVVLLAAFLGATFAFYYNRKKDWDLFKLKTEYDAYLEVEKRLSSLLNKTSSLTSALDGIERSINIAEITDRMLVPSEAEINKRKSFYNSLRNAYQEYADAWAEFQTCNEANQIFLLEVALLVKTIARIHTKSFGIYEYVGRVQVAFLSSPKGIPEGDSKKNIVEEAKMWNKIIYDVLVLLYDYRTETQNYYFSKFLNKKIPQRNPLIQDSTTIRLIKPHWYLVHNNNQDLITEIRKMIYKCQAVVGELMQLTSYEDAGVNALHDMLYNYLDSFNKETQGQISKSIQDLKTKYAMDPDNNKRNNIAEAQTIFSAIEEAVIKNKLIIDEIAY